MSSLSTSESRPTGRPGPDPLLVLLDPVARRSDGESVRIARDVLCGGADVKVALPESPSELDRALARRGRRRPVVIGSDLAVQRVLQALHRHRELGADALGVVPVGRPGAVAKIRALGVPPEPVAAARAVIAGVSRKLDLLIDDTDEVVLGDLRIHPYRWGRAGGLRSLWAKFAAAEQATAPAGHPRLRIEADGRLLADVHRPPCRLDITVPVGEGVLELWLHTGGEPRRVRAGSLTVAGRGFGCEADGRALGPLGARTWTVRAGAWELVLPAG
ncbi:MULTISPECIES: diacylglycerol kinase family protein [Kitasatospora]|uniref:Diacylglycerol kinase family protein n=1 Tax=Kitasatospora cystarginea TaxID=58350 RepID=A0ABN3E6C7_9ACTN